MLLHTPKDKAIQSIRVAMSLIFTTNKVELAQRLGDELERSTSDISARMLRPSWYSLDVDPYQVMGLGLSGKGLLSAAVRHLWHASVYFEAAGMFRAASVCLKFCAQVVTDELLTGQDRASGTVDNL